MTVAREVAPGRDAAFEEWAADLTAAAAGFPGFLGAGLLRPGHVGQPWHVGYRFDSPARLAEWEASEVRAHLLAQADGLMQTTAVQRMSGLETWFELPGRTAPAPPKWKMFLVSVCAIASLQVLLHLVLDTAVSGWPLVAKVAVVAVPVTALMTWVVMPQVARLLERWLYAPPRHP